MQTRKVNRKPASLPGRYFNGRGAPVDVIFADISRNGCRFRCDARDLAIGARLQIYVATWGPYHATVQWVSQGEFGVRFAAPIDEAEFSQFKNSHVRVFTPDLTADDFDAMPKSLPNRFC